MGEAKYVLECELVASKQLLQDFLIAAATFVRRKHRGPTPAADISPQTTVLPKPWWRFNA